MKNKNTTPKPVNKENQNIGEEYLAALRRGNYTEAALLYDRIKSEKRVQMQNDFMEQVTEELGFHKEKFDTHRNKINEIATELNGLSEQAHERFLDLAKINAAISQVLDNQEAELKGMIRWHRFFLCVIAVIQVFMMVKLALNK